MPPPSCPWQHRPILFMIVVFQNTRPPQIQIQIQKLTIPTIPIFNHLPNLSVCQISSPSSVCTYSDPLPAIFASLVSTNTVLLRLGVLFKDQRGPSPAILYWGSWLLSASLDLVQTWVGIGRTEGAVADSPPVLRVERAVPESPPMLRVERVTYLIASRWQKNPDQYM